MTNELARVYTGAFLQSRARNTRARVGMFITGKVRQYMYETVVFEATSNPVFESGLGLDRV